VQLTGLRAAGPASEGPGPGGDRAHGAVEGPLHDTVRPACESYGGRGGTVHGAVEDPVVEGRRRACEPHRRRDEEDMRDTFEAQPITEPRLRPLGQGQLA
jgi:hypothetical protein